MQRMAGQLIPQSNPGPGWNVSKCASQFSKYCPCPCTHWFAPLQQYTRPTALLEDALEPHFTLSGTHCVNFPARNVQSPSAVHLLCVQFKSPSGPIPQLTHLSHLPILEGDKDEDELPTVPFKNPGVPRITGPGSNPRVVTAVFQLLCKVPTVRRLSRSILAFGCPAAFTPANGAPTPSSAASTICPSALYKRMERSLSGSIMFVEAKTGITANRESFSGYRLTTTNSPTPMRIPCGRVARITSPAPFPARSVYPLTSIHPPIAPPILSTAVSSTH